MFLKHVSSPGISMISTVTQDCWLVSAFSAINRPLAQSPRRTLWWHSNDVMPYPGCSLGASIGLTDRITILIPNISVTPWNNNLMTKETCSAGVEVFYWNTLATWGLAWAMAKGEWPNCIHSTSVYPCSNYNPHAQPCTPTQNIVQYGAEERYCVRQVHMKIQI